MLSQEPGSGDIAWRSATRCAAGDCMEVGASDGMIAVRDSKDTAGPVFFYTPTEWAAFVEGVKSGDFDDLA